MSDKYRNFAELAAAEIKTVDYKIKCENRESNILIIAPHGGGIEQGTSEIAVAIAGEEFSFYCFEGKKETGNEDLHITSTRFDEPTALELVKQSEIVVAIHGLQEEKEVIYVGGRDRELKMEFISALTQAGFEAKEDNSHHAGTFSSNICNRGTSGKGVQLEISHGLRRTMFEGLNRQGRRKIKQPFQGLVEVVRLVLLNI